MIFTSSLVLTSKMNKGTVRETKNKRTKAQFVFRRWTKNYELFFLEREGAKNKNINKRKLQRCLKNSTMSSIVTVK